MQEKVLGLLRDIQNICQTIVHYHFKQKFFIYSTTIVNSFPCLNHSTTILKVKVVRSHVSTHCFFQFPLSLVSIHPILFPPIFLEEGVVLVLPYSRGMMSSWKKKLFDLFWEFTPIASISGRSSSLNEQMPPNPGRKLPECRRNGR